MDSELHSRQHSSHTTDEVLYGASQFSSQVASSSLPASRTDDGPSRDQGPRTDTCDRTIIDVTAAQPDATRSQYIASPSPRIKIELLRVSGAWCWLTFSLGISFTKASILGHRAALATRCAAQHSDKASLGPCYPSPVGVPLVAVAPRGPVPHLEQFVHVATPIGVAA